jgi:hypothetical protein
MINPSTLKPTTTVQLNAALNDDDDKPPALPPRPKFSV